MSIHNQLNYMYWPLRLCYGLVPIVAGADKFTNLLTDWSQYLPAAAANVLPFAAASPLTESDVINSSRRSFGSLSLSTPNAHKRVRCARPASSPVIQNTGGEN